MAPSVGLGPLTPRLSLWGLAAGSTCSESAGISTVIRPLVAPLLAVWGSDNSICGHGSIGSVWRGVWLS